MGKMKELFMDVCEQEQCLEDTDWLAVQNMIDEYKCEEELLEINKELEVCEEE